MKSIKIFEIGRIRLSFAWYDLWIGAYIDTQNKKLYICVIPTILLTINFS